MTTLQEAVQRFTPLDPDLMARRLGRPGPMPRVIIDTDTANEIDDQYALASRYTDTSYAILLGAGPRNFQESHTNFCLVQR